MLLRAVVIAIASLAPYCWLHHHDALLLLAVDVTIRLRLTSLDATPLHLRADGVRDTVQVSVCCHGQQQCCRHSCLL